MRHFLALLALLLGGSAALAAAGDPNTTTLPNLVVATNITLGGVARNSWPAGGANPTWEDVLNKPTGLVSNAVASAGLLAVDATKTNGIAATSAMVSALQTNVTLVSLGVDTNSIVAQATNSSKLWADGLTNTVVQMATNSAFTFTSAWTNKVTRASVTNALAATGSGADILLGNGNWGVIAFANVTNGLAAPNDTAVYLNGKGLWATPAGAVTYANVTNALSAPNSAAVWLDGTGAWSAPGGAGNVVNTGASVANMVPIYTDNTGTAVTPTNAPVLSTVWLTTTNVADALAGKFDISATNDFAAGITNQAQANATATFQPIITPSTDLTFNSLGGGTITQTSGGQVDYLYGTDHTLTNLVPLFPTNAFAAISAQLYQATNAALTALAGNPQLYQATNANLTALAGNANLYQATNTVLTHYQGTDTNALLSALGGAPLSNPTFTGTATAPTAAIATATIGDGTVTNNIVSLFSAPALAQYIDVSKSGQSAVSNRITGALTILAATNGVNGAFANVVYAIYAEGDQTLTLPIENASHEDGWLTNAFSPVPTKATNGITYIYLKGSGLSDNLARQTNYHVSFEYFPR